MRILMHTEEDLDISEFFDPDMMVESHDHDAAYSALQMFATALALCSFSVLAAYGEAIGVPVNGVSIRMRWSYAQAENRIDAMSMDVHWPELPDSRREAARRAAASCTLHHTLEHALTIDTRVRVPS